MLILGISAFYHDSAACLMRDEQVVAAAQEERFTRKKHDFGFPANAIKYCFREGGIEAKDLDYIAYYDKPFLKFERILETYLAVAPRGIGTFIRAMPQWLRQKLWISDLIKKELGYEGEIVFPSHHESHAASAFFASPFKEAAILTMDGVGEWATTAYGIGRGNKIELKQQITFPHSLGLLYSAFTYYTGFKVNSGEYKLMGLAPYGEPKYKDLILEKLIDLNEDGSFKLNLKYFAYTHSMRTTNKKFNQLFGGPPRTSETPIDQRHKDIARSIQAVTEDVVMAMASHVHKETKMENLCLAGGVALNCVSNGRLVRESPFKDIYVQPAAGDAGCALGAASLAYYHWLGNERKAKTVLPSPYVGPGFSDEEIEKALKERGAVYKKLNPKDLLKQTAKLMADRRVVGWFQGRMEFGPRALGNRSILADATDEKMQKNLNLKIKFRESFRPFAPTVMLDKSQEYFELDRPSPYMLLVAQVCEKNRVIPSVTHVDHSARIQTVSREENPLYYDLIKEFYKLTGVPVIINTSFNVRGEPIVCTPDDAYTCFMRTNMDNLVTGPYRMNKEDQPKFEEDEDWRQEFELD